MTTDLGPHRPGHTTTQPCPPNPGPSQIHNQSSKRQDPSSWKQPLRSIVQVSVSNQNHPAFLKPPPNAHSPGKQTQIRLSIYLICAVTPRQTEKLPHTHRVVDHLSQPTHLTRSPSEFDYLRALPNTPDKSIIFWLPQISAIFATTYKHLPSSLPRGVERKL